MLFAQIDPWQFQPHPEVWLLLVGIIGLGFYATRVIGPKVVKADSVDSEGNPLEIATQKQRRYFTAAVITLAIAADWPMHDIAERYLYSVHMFQHLMITFFIPILFLKATPEWLARLVLGGGDQERTLVGKLAKPVFAGLTFNLLAALTHWNGIVQLSFDSGPFHYSIHLLMFSSALLMWLPVHGPLPELRLQVPAQVIYLFLMSIIPTVPAGWLTFADNPVYPAYDTVERLWNISSVNDQQMAGFIMKVLGGFFLWVMIGIKFFGYAAKERASDFEKRVVHPLTYDEVEKEFKRTEPSRVVTDEDANS